VTATEPIHDRLRRAFAPTPHGVVGLVEQLLRAWAGASGSVEFERVGDRCACRWTVGGDTQEAPVPVPPAAFRALLAQVAARCGASPYGGDTALTLAGDSATVLRVAFVNTPEKQHLKLTSSVAEPSEAGTPKPHSEPAVRDRPHTVPT